MDDFVSGAGVGVDLLLLELLGFVGVLLWALFLVLGLVSMLLLEALHERFV